MSTSTSTVSDNATSSSNDARFNKLLEACIDGKPLLIAACLIELKQQKHYKLLSRQHRNENGEIMTPFLIVVKNHHIRAAKLLLSLFSVDPNDTCHRGTINFDGYPVQGYNLLSDNYRLHFSARQFLVDNMPQIMPRATPLWCAAGIGCFDMIKLLVEYGADVNACTVSNSSPLRAACFHGDVNIVKYLLDNGADMNITNHYNNSCLMVAAYRGKSEVVSHLLKRGADPDVQAICEGSALHYAVEGKHLDVVKILTEEGGSIDIKNKEGMTAPMLAADCGHAKMVEYFSSLEQIKAIDKITWLELLGAAMTNDKDKYNIDISYHYYHLAMLYRVQDGLPKSTLPPIAAYNNRVECTSTTELTAIKDNEDAMQMEALIIRERILGKNNMELCHPIVYRGAVYADNLQFARGIALWQHAIDIKQHNKEVSNSDLFRFAEVFSQMVWFGEEINISSLDRVIQSCYKELIHAKDKVKQFKEKEKMKTPSSSLPLCNNHKESASVAQAQLEGVMHAMLYLLFIASKTVKEENDLHIIEKITYQFIKLDVRDVEGRTPLHLVVDETTPVDEFHVRDICAFPNVQLTDLLLRCGANPNVISNDGNTPLHVIVQYRKPISDFWTLHMIITKLLHYGAHPDTKNKQDQAPLSIALTGVAEIIMKTESKTTLQCLAATAVRKYNLRYKNIVPKSVEAFVDLH